MTPFGSPGAKTVTARNGVTVPAPITANGQITISADGAAPARVLARRPGGRRRRSAPASPSPQRRPTVPAPASARSTSSTATRRTRRRPCDTGLFESRSAARRRPLPAGSTPSPGTTRLTDGHEYALAAVATDNVGHTTTSTAEHRHGRQQRAERRGRGADAVSGGAVPVVRRGEQDALAERDAGAARSSSHATADDPDSGIASVTFPALLGTGAQRRHRDGPVRLGATYRFDAPARTRPASTSITRRERRHRSLPPSHEQRRRSTSTVDGAAPATNPTFPLNNGSYDNTTWNRSPAARTRGHLRHRHRRGLGRRAGEALDQGQHDRQVLRRRRLHTAVADVTSPASLAGNNWSYGLDQSELTAPHVYVVELFAVDNVGNAETHQHDPLHLRQRHRRADDHADARPARRTRRSTRSARGDYNLYYCTANGGGGFTLHASSTDPSGVDTVTFPDLSGTTGFSGSGGTSTNGVSADPFAVDSPAYTFTSAATTAARRRKPSRPPTCAATRATTRVTFLLDNAAPTGGTPHRERPAHGAYSIVTTTTICTVAHRTTPPTGPAPASPPPSLTVASRAARQRHVRQLRRPAAPVERRQLLRVASGNCYRFTLTGTDNVGNAASTDTTLKVDTTAPSQPSVAFTGLSSGNTFDDGAGHALLPAVGRRHVHGRTRTARPTPSPA